MLLVDSFPDVGDLGDKDLKDFLDRLVTEERDVLTEELEASSYERHIILHGKIDVVRAELVNRRRRRREGGAGPREPRRPNPQPGGGSISLPAPEAPEDDDPHAVVAIADVQQ
jgi:hypothetical protein